MASARRIAAVDPPERGTVDGFREQEPVEAVRPTEPIEQPARLWRHTDELDARAATLALQRRLDDYSEAAGIHERQTADVDDDFPSGTGKARAPANSARTGLRFPEAELADDT
jgi:hypothetical protein